MTRVQNVFPKCHVARAVRVFVAFFACYCAITVILLMRSKYISKNSSDVRSDLMRILPFWRKDGNDSDLLWRTATETERQSGLRDSKFSHSLRFDAAHYLTKTKAKNPCKNTCYLTTDLSGRLANQMFQYASLLGIAVLNQRLGSAFYPPQTALTNAFGVTHLDGRGFKGYQVIDEKSFASYDPKFERLPPNDVLIMQYFQSWRYFHHIRDVVLKEFTFIPSVQQAANVLMDKCLKNRKNATKIGVHVRRGDMVASVTKRKGFNSPPPSYFQKASEKFRSTHGDVIFIIVTDDPAWCETNLKLRDAVIADRTSTEEHLALLANCDHVIMSAGTFGWWGGYLAGGDVIYYAKEVTPNTEAGLGLNHSDHYLPTWTAMED